MTVIQPVKKFPVAVKPEVITTMKIPRLDPILNHVMSS
jgi:hypothetical protein